MFSNIVLDDQIHKIERFKLKKWLVLEDIRQNIYQAEDRSRLAKLIYSYLFCVLPEVEFESLPWFELADAYLDIDKVNSPTIFPPFLSSKRKDKRPIWEYDGRTWYLWANYFAGTYHWSLDEIAELDIDDALCLLQEILVSDQLKKEWQWGLSEIAYPYNKSSKRSEFKPLNRPDWMRYRISSEPIKKVKIPKHMMPIGNVIKYDGNKDIESRQSN